MSMLQFTFGPVQGFVAQARTTRDFWAGSYLLSYLAGSALVAALTVDSSASLGGLRLVIPAEDDSLLRALQGEATLEQLQAAGELGTLPNRFRVDGDPEALRRAAQAASDGLQAAWRSIAEAVWSRLQQADMREEQMTRALAEQWQRQVERQWEIAWVTSDDPSGLDLRKNWRVFNPLDEPGVRCSQCGQRSALSPSGGGRHGDVARFWREVADRFNRGKDRYQFRPGERLCAICTIKRLYPLVSEKALGHGLKPRIHYASTATVAVTDWVDEVRQRADKDPDVREAWERVQSLAQKAGVFCLRHCQLEDRPYEYDGYLYFADELKQQGRPLPEMLGLDSSRHRQGDGASAGSSSDLTPGFGPASGAASASGSGLADTDVDAQAGDLQLPDVLLLKDESKRSELVQAVRDLKNVMRHGPRPVYALLVMDGDHMGALLNRPDIDPGDVSKALSQFSAEVRRLVAQHRGRPVYAGGDDVLALLPAQRALDVAREIRRTYIRCFAELNAKVGGAGARNIATISAGIVYADMREPLRDVIAAGHRVLDEVAKDASGRDAFALLMLKHSGAEAVLSKKWEEKIGRSEGGSAQTIDWVGEVCQLVKDIRSDEVSTRLLYNLRNLFQTLAPEGHLPDRMVQSDEAVRFIASEYLRNRLLPWPDDATPAHKLERALEQARRLLGIATVRRELTGSVPEAAAGATHPAAGVWSVNLDGPIVARFLADKERVV